MPNLLSRTRPDVFTDHGCHVERVKHYLKPQALSIVILADGALVLGPRYSPAN